MTEVGHPAGTDLDGPVRAAMEPLRRDLSTSALLVDYDGTLAPIVADPAGARPLPGVRPVLAALAEAMQVVAVVSGRPVAFLADALGRLPGIRLFGLYGMERQGGSEPPSVVPEARRWRSVVAAVADRAEADAPPGVTVERKGLTVTVHWRGQADAAPWATSFVRREAATSGLLCQPGRMALELRPPLGVDKGTVVAECGRGARAVAFIGDDLGDLPAFSAIAALRSPDRYATAVAAVDQETAAEVRRAADVTVPGPGGVLALLGWLAGRPTP